MQNTISSLGIEPGTDYYGRNYGELVYHENDVYDGIYNAPVDSFAFTGPGPYPTQAYTSMGNVGSLLNDFSQDFTASFSESSSELLIQQPSESLASEYSTTAPQEYSSSPVLEQHQQFDPSAAHTLLSPNSYTYEPETLYHQQQSQDPYNIYHGFQIPEQETSEGSDCESQPPTPDSVHSETPLSSQEELLSLLPRDVALAQKPQSIPLLPTDPQSAVAQLFACKEMWAKACHTKKGVFICTNCHRNGKPLSFRTMLELAVHFDSHGLMKKSKCEKPSCPWSVVGFSTRSEKNRHTKSQHSDLNFPCQLCGRRFGRCDSLKRHMKLLHDIVPTGKRSKRSTAKKATTTSIKTEHKHSSNLGVIPTSPVSEEERMKTEAISAPLRWTNPQDYFSFVTRS